MPPSFVVHILNPFLFCDCSDWQIPIIKYAPGCFISFNNFSYIIVVLFETIIISPCEGFQVEDFSPGG